VTATAQVGADALVRPLLSDCHHERSEAPAERSRKTPRTFGISTIFGRLFHHDSKRSSTKVTEKARRTSYLR
jgi:hypothetical protein